MYVLKKNVEEIQWKSNLQIHAALFPQNNSGKLGVELFYFVTLLLHEAYIINQDLLK